jgi:hypothetical protein
MTDCINAFNCQYTSEKLDEKHSFSRRNINWPDEAWSSVNNF